MTKIVSVELMRELERQTDARGHSYRAMMEEAGRSVAEAVLQNWIGQDLHVLTLVGPGNNGGDGLVASRYLAQAGATVTVYVWKRKQVEEDLVQDAPLTILHHAHDPQLTALRAALSQANIVLDALLGTGANRPITSPLADILEAVKAEKISRNKRPRPLLLDPHLRTPIEKEPLTVVAVDCPSGLNNDTGEVDPHTVPAEMTVTFAFPKVGQLRFPGAATVGELLIADIGIEEPEDPTLPELITADWVAERLPERPPNAHKGTFGKALLVAGSVNYTGAAWLAGAAATHSGTGLVTLAVPRPLQSTLAATLHETTWLLLPHDLGVIDASAVTTVREQVGNYNALLVGPGLTREKTTVEFVIQLLAPGLLAQKTPSFVPPEGNSHPRGSLGFLPTSSSPEEETRPSPRELPRLVVDADALNALAQFEDWAQHVVRGAVFTPHPGEMARLCGLTTKEVQARRWELAREKARAWGEVILLKGAHTVIAAPDGRLAVLPFANPALATAGSGDVLAGIIVGLLAQGLEPFEAAVCGGFIHGMAGEYARSTIGDAGVVAGDLIPHIAEVIDDLRDALP
ncbi:MAG: bifunctional ADP-dependent NAD(P)H-hydrate dehydratase/NAD(P)H-hydrate epimerase [Chloroflexi bacterium]|nr:bifunctional ADP-dependent NAD(P)H-hydrate dehydratase/NAD(P)H-hydrate epimerase [Chloroflexota bacterium]